MNEKQALEKARLWEENQTKFLTMTKEEARKKRKIQSLPPIYTDTGDLYTGPYDPCKMIKYLLRALFTTTELSGMSAGGKRTASGGNAQVPTEILDAIVKFTLRHCPNALLSKRHINESINSACSYARKKESMDKREEREF